MPAIDVGREYEVHIFGVILINALLHGQVEEEIDDVAELHQIDFVSHLDLLKDKGFDRVECFLHLVLLEFIPDCHRDQMVVFKFFGVEKSILERG